MEQAAPASEARSVKYGGFWRRFAAYVIDWIVLLVVSGILGAMAGAGGGILGGIIGIVYVIGFWAWRGQTPGKMAMGVQIVMADGSPIGLGRAVLRYIGYIVSGIILGIGFLMIGWDRRKQGLHDKIAGTVVVMTG
jgi:uncharacterized RDD family membrane protein YckC